MFDPNDVSTYGRGQIVISNGTAYAVVSDTPSGTPGISPDYEPITINSGITGATGVTGTTTGATGPQGQDGTFVTILESYNSYADLIAAHPTGNVGDSYLVNGDLYVWSASQYKQLGEFKGQLVLPDLRVRLALQVLRA